MSDIWNTGFVGTNLFHPKDTMVVYTAEDVHLDYFRRLARVYKGVQRFKRCWGSDSLYKLARDPNRSDNEKISDIIDIRLALKIPMLEPMGWTDEGSIKFGLRQNADMSIRSENRIRLAAHLPML